jgi:DNA-binding XRE family transcriptional regulator
MMERERHGLPKTVRNAIRTLLDQGKTQQEVADQWGVSRETISAIATQRVYKMDGKSDERPKEQETD